MPKLGVKLGPSWHQIAPKIDLQIDDKNASISGRSWEIWRLDEAGVGGSITANVPEIELFGGQPLADGALTAIVSLRGLPTADFDAESFLWGELSEQADTRAHTATKTLQQP